jgi:6-phosphogluconolactonase
VRVFPDQPSLYAAAAEHIAGKLQGALRTRQRACFVLTGGNTPRPVYDLLSRPPLLSRVDWGRVHLFWGDERCVPPDHPDSNFNMARQSLLAGIGAPESLIHRMLAELEDHEKAARLYEEELERLFPGTSPPAFDLVLLGMGDDGHTASLFPGTQWDESRLVVPNYVPKFGAWRITMTPRLLNAARSVVFLTAGAGKALALARVLDGPPGSIPAQRIQPESGSLTWMVDEEAGALLKTSRR